MLYEMEFYEKKIYKFHNDIIKKKLDQTKKKLKYY